MSVERLKIGTVGYPVGKSLVHSAVDVVELTEGRRIPPKRGAAKKWRAAAPGHVSFTIQLSRHLFDPLDEKVPMPGDAAGYGGFQVSEENTGLWRRELDFADAVGAEILVLITPPTFTPSGPNRRRMAEFFENLDRDNHVIVWEPHGPWDPETAAEVAGEMGLCLAVDPLRDPVPEGGVAYMRLGPFSVMGSRMGVYDLEQLVVAAEPFERAFCLFDTHRALDDARNLKRLLAGEDFDLD